jgi:hypothetical protein
MEDRENWALPQPTPEARGGDRRLIPPIHPQDLREADGHRGEVGTPPES